MRIYINGTLSNEQETFLPADFFFSNENAEYTDIVSENCIEIYGMECESSVNDKSFSCRWKGVLLSSIDDNGDIIEKEIYSVDEVLDIIKAGNLKLNNIMAYFDSNVKVDITDVEIEDSEKQVKLDKKFLNSEPIEMIV